MSVMQPVNVKAVNVKAVPVNALVEFVRKELSGEQLQSVLGKFSPADAGLFTGHLLATDQVPVRAVNEFTRLSAAAKGEPVKAFGRRAGRFGAEQGVRSVYRFIMMVMSTESVLRKAPFMWTRVYDGGEMEVEALPKSAKIHIRNFPSEEAGCARITGWFEKIGELSGAKNLRTAHISCMAEGGKDCTWTFEWQ
ncbi:MAG TPA: hypothetical protein VHL58_08980 [Thermoanaerobaculia bacterium]|nr:hypothetical protein [Thermoanaerobaculia bacterium]